MTDHDATAVAYDAIKTVRAAAEVLSVFPSPSGSGYGSTVTVFVTVEVAEAMGRLGLEVDRHTADIANIGSREFICARMSERGVDITFHSSRPVQDSLMAGPEMMPISEEAKP